MNRDDGTATHPRIAVVTEHRDAVALRQVRPEASLLAAWHAREALRQRLFGVVPSQPRLGRYVLRGPLGEGSGGIVFRARDPELQRDIAIKLVAPTRTSDPRASRALLHEARRAARVDHPNVVRILDVGTHDLLGLTGEIDSPGVFVVMELVEGQPLHSWLRARPRGIRQVLQSFAAAGRGLAAAHRCGVVHRDFKPSNVMMSEQGRVVVVDFGLAVTRGDATSSRTAAGTHRYMAPEQRDNDADVGPAADQYAFCVALTEALADATGSRFTDAEPLVVAARLRSVPGSLRRTLRRGLQLDPRQRFPDMDTLADRLERAASYRMRRRAIASMLGVATAVGIIATATMPRESAACPGIDPASTLPWTEAQRAVVEDSLRAIRPALVPNTPEATLARLDEQAEALREERARLCRPNRAMSDLDSRAAVCLQRRTAIFAAMTDLLRTADPDQASRIPVVLSHLAHPEGCEDMSEAAPTEGAEAHRLADLALVRSRTLLLGGDFVAARRVAVTVIDDAQRLGEAAIERGARLVWATASFELGARDEARDVAQTVARSALAVGADDDVFRAALLSAKIEMLLGNPTGAEVWLVMARGALSSGEHDSARVAALEHDTAMLAIAQERFDDATAAATRALSLVGPDDEPLQGLVNTSLLVNALRRTGAVDEGRQLVANALPTAVRELGPTHPATLDLRSEAALLEEHAGRHDAAFILSRGVWADMDHRYGPASGATIDAALDTGGSALQAGLYDEARVAFRAAIEGATRAGDEFRPALGIAYLNLARLELTTRRYTEALSAARAARQRLSGIASTPSALGLATLWMSLAQSQLGHSQIAGELALEAEQTFRRAYGDTHPLVISTIAERAWLLAAAGRPSEAHALCTSAIPRVDDPLTRAIAAHRCGLVALADGRTDAAVALGTEALRTNDGSLDAPLQARLQAMLARALWTRGTTDDRARAIALARAAWLDFRHRDCAPGDGLAEPEAWLSRSEFLECTE